MSKKILVTSNTTKKEIKKEKLSVSSYSTSAFIREKAFILLESSRYLPAVGKILYVENISSEALRLHGHARSSTVALHA